MFFPLLLLLLSSCFFLVFVKKKASVNPKLPPGPHLWGLLGNIFPLKKEHHVWFADLAQTYGELMSVRLGQKLIVVASSANAASQVLKTHDRLLHGKYIPAVISKIPQIEESSLVFSVNPDTWNFLRSVCHAKFFSNKSLDSHTKLRERKANQMVGYLRGKQNMPVKIDNLLFSAIINVISSVLVSQDLVDFKEEAENGTLKEHFRVLLKAASTPGLGDIHTMLDIFDVWSRRKGILLGKKMKFIWEDIVKERRDHLKQNGVRLTEDVLDVLINNSFNDEKIYNFLTELALAGVESTQVHIEWFMGHLLKNEEIMLKLRQEIAVDIKEHGLNLNSLSELPYMQAIMKEILRLYPPGPLMIPHRALQTCQIMNYSIPKDSLVLVNQWALGRDPLIWDDPLKFRPERFLNSDKDFRGTHSEFMPFGAGRRICPGMLIATKQIPLLVASLVHNFDWVLPHGMDPSELSLNAAPRVALSPESPLVLIPKARSLAQPMNKSS